MNLAWKDIRFHFLRFILTVIGVAALLTAAMGMIGLYRGIVFEALLLINDIGADLWVAQGSRLGPFAETSIISGSVDRRLEGVPGVLKVRRFIQYTQLYEVEGRLLEMAITGLDFPRDTGDWIPLNAGRYFYSNHYEAIADQSLGLSVGDRLRLGLDDYTVVGVALGQVDMTGTGIFFVTVPDAQTLSTTAPSEAVLLNRAGRISSAGYGQDRVGAVMVTLAAWASQRQVADFISNWGDVVVTTRDDQKEIMLNGRLWQLLIQILSFVAATLLVTGIVISLSIYTMTVEKTPQIALLKLIGADDRVIARMILNQALMIGVLALFLGVSLSYLIFPYFPHRVLLLSTDILELGLVVVLVCVTASSLGIRKALRVRAQEVLS